MASIEAVKDKKGTLTKDQQGKVAKWHVFVDRDELKEVLHALAHHKTAEKAKEIYDELLSEQETAEPEHPIEDELEEDLTGEEEEPTTLPAGDDLPPVPAH